MTMSIAVLTHPTSIASLLATISPDIRLQRANVHTDEDTFQSFIQAEKPQFAILTSEYANQSNLFTGLRQASPGTQIIVCVLPNFSKPSACWSLLDDLDKYILCMLSELNDCLSMLSKGYLYVSSLLSTYPTSFRPEPFPGCHMLTPCERRVLTLMAKGHSGPQIAQTLFISAKTVENHKYKISQKLNVTGGPGSLVKYSLLNREKLLSLSDNEDNQE